MHAIIRTYVATTILAMGSFPLAAAEPRSHLPVAADIDRLVNLKLAEAKVPASAVADDAEFLRRVYLDITGRIPTASQTTAFLDSPDPAKRAKLIDELLASSHYGQHFGTIWINLFVRRDANQIRPPDPRPLQKWLAEGFNQNHGWDQTVRAILTAEGTGPEGTWFILNGDSRNIPQPNIITRSVSNLFLGVNMQCAECHDHPLNDAWKQTDFWGVAAFFGRVRNTGGAKGAGGIVESATPVAVKGGGKNPQPKVSGPAIAIPDTAFKNVGKVVPAQMPGGKEPPELDAKGPLRPAFAAWLTAGENPYFARTAVNRLWAHFLGTGFVNPLADFSDDNPPSHPELLARLAQEFTASGYDQKHLIRCICNSQAYQRTSRPLPDNKKDDKLFSHMGVKVLSPNVLADSLTVALETTNLFPAPPAPAKRGTGAQPPTYSPTEQFINFFTTKEEDAEPGEYAHGVPQALRLMNQVQFNAGGAVVERLMKTAGTPEKIVEGLYLAALSRRPSPAETKEMTDFVARQKTPRDGYNGVLWVLINSSEFIINR